MTSAGGGRPARYVAIITDGNGRWAERQGLPPVEGHRAGADVVKARLRDAVEFGLRELKEAGEAGADDEHRAEVELQKLTDTRIADLETALKAKEAEILEV